MATDGGPSPRSPFVAVADGVRVALKITPRAARSAVVGVVDGVDGDRLLKVTVTAVPADGKANAAVTALLAKLWRVPKSALTVVAGATERTKVIHVAGDPEALIAAMTDSLPPS